MKYAPVYRVGWAFIGGAILLLSGCANLFTGNFFENFDGPPSASDLINSYDASNPGAFVDSIAEAAESPRFLNGLSAAERDSLTTSLADVYGGSADVATRQEAAILAATVNITGTAAGDTINNVADIVTSGTTNDFSDPQKLLEAIIPAEAQGDATAVQAILDDLVQAAAAYDALGTTLTSGGDNADPPADANMTAIAQNAVVALAIQSLSTQAGSTATLAAEIVSGSFGSYTDPIAGADDDTTPLGAILAAGGLDGVFSGT
jgi:hypothetical protein